MFEFFTLDVVQYGIVGLIYGLIGSTPVVFPLIKDRKKRFALVERLFQGGLSGHVLVLANYQFKFFAEPSLSLSALLGVTGGIIGLGFIFGIADLVAGKFGIDSKALEGRLTASRNAIERVNESEKIAEKAEQSSSKTEIEKVEEELKNNLREVEKRLHELESKQG